MGKQGLACGCILPVAVVVFLIASYVIPEQRMNAEMVEAQAKARAEKEAEEARQSELAEAEKTTRVLCPFCKEMVDERKEMVTVERRTLEMAGRADRRWPPDAEEFSDSPCSAALCQKAAKIKKKHPSSDSRECYYVADRKVWVGISPAQAEASWGKPYRINRTSTAYGTTEQWCYSSGSFLYFEKDWLGIRKCTAVQN